MQRCSGEGGSWVGNAGSLPDTTPPRRCTPVSVAASYTAAAAVCASQGPHLLTDERDPREMSGGSPAAMEEVKRVLSKEGFDLKCV